jgi:hypothetical protein
VVASLRISPTVSQADAGAIWVWVQPNARTVWLLLAQTPDILSDGRISVRTSTEGINHETID